ncbi:MAG: GNAT family N-acetyltransferase [Bacteroidales bacterium]|nr:GNAT family N-acetyltransferase [Bacteroidales bacterium]
MNIIAKRIENLIPGKIKRESEVNNTVNNKKINKNNVHKIDIMVANENHLVYVDDILETIAEAAKIRGTGIARRSPEYIRKKIVEGKAIIALDNNKFVGFCYIESWGHEKFVANSGLIVIEEYRGQGLAKRIKKMAFDLSRKKFPNAKLFGLTTGLAVMKINSELGYKPVTFSELTDDDDFWKGCESCINHDILMRTQRKHCLCTGMLYDPAWEKAKNKNTRVNKKHSLKTYDRWLKFKQYILLNKKNKI